MSTETDLRETRPYPTRGGILADFPEWAYLAVVPDTARPPTEAEAARDAARRADPEWAWLFDLASRPPPSAPRISAPVSLTVAGDTQPVPGPEAPAAGAERAPAADESPEPLAADPGAAAADRAQADSEVSLRRWGVTETIPATAAEDAG